MAEVVTKSKGVSRKGGKKNRKYGRNKTRGASNKTQALRSAKNKRVRIEREARRLAQPKKLNKARGTARQLRRWGMTRQATTTVQG